MGLYEDMLYIALRTHISYVAGYRNCYNFV